MARAASIPSSSSSTVFIDTNLDTHLALVVLPDDTVADLKGKIKVEHANCFSEIGEVSIQALKVKRRAFYYHLSDSMHVKSAFNGIEGTWYLYLDIEPTESTVKVEKKYPEVISTLTSEQGKQLRMPYSSGLLVRGEDMPGNGMQIEQQMIQTSISNARETGTWPDVLLQKPSSEGKLLLPDDSAQSQFLHVSDELDRRRNPDVPETETITEGHTTVGPGHQQKSEQVADEGSKVKVGDNPNNVDVGEDVNVPAHPTKKGKSRNRSRDLSKDPYLDGRSEHSRMEKKRRKEKDQPFEKPLEDQLTEPNRESSVHHKETCQLEKNLAENIFQKKHESSLVPSKEFPGKPSDGDILLQQMPSDKQKKKRRKKDQLSENDKAPLNAPIENSLKKTNDALGKQTCEGNHAEGFLNNRNLVKEPMAVELIEESTQAVLDGTSQLIDGNQNKKKKKKKDLSENVEASHKMINNSSNKIDITQETKSTEENYVEELLNNCTDLEKEPNKADITEESSQKVLDGSAELINDTPKEKKKAKKQSSENDEAPQPIDNKLKKTDAVLVGKPATEKCHAEGSVNSLTNLGKVPNAAELTEESTQKMLDTSSEVGMADPLPNKLKKSNHTCKRLTENTAISTVIAFQEVNNDNLEGLLHGNTEPLSKETDAAQICKDAEWPSNHAVKVDSEVPLNSRRSRKKSRIEEDVPSRHDDVGSSAKPVNDGNNVKESGNSHEVVSKISGAVMNATSLGNEKATKSGIPSEICAESSHLYRKKKSQKSDSQYKTYDTGRLSGDQVPVENQNKVSNAPQKNPQKKFKESVIPEDAVAVDNSAVVESTLPSSPSGKSQKRGKKKSKKIEPHQHQQESNLHSSTIETHSSSRDQETENFPKETSTSQRECPGNELKEAAVVGKTVENSATDQSIPVISNNKRSKRSKKKSEISEQPSREDDTTHSWVDKVTEENLKESVKKDTKGSFGSHLEHSCIEPEKLPVFSEAEIVANPMAVHLNPNDKNSKRRKKKSGMTELPSKESSKDGANDSLMKVAPPERPGETLDGSIGDISESAIAIEEVADPANTVKLGSATECRNSCHLDAEGDRSVLSDHTHENLEKVSAVISKSSNERKASLSLEVTDQNKDHANPANLDSTGFKHSYEKNETGQLSANNLVDNTMRLQKVYEKLDTEAFHDTPHKGSTESMEADDYRNPPKSDDGKIDFLRCFAPKVNQPKTAQENSSMEAEAKKSSGEKTKRKRKLNPSPHDSATELLNPAVSDKQHFVPKKPQNKDSGKHRLDDAAAEITTELLYSKKPRKKDATSLQKSDVHLNASSDVGSPRMSRDDNRPGKKMQDNDTHFWASLSRDVEDKSLNEKNFMNTESMLQSLSHNKDDATIISASEVPKNKNLDASVRSASVCKNSSNALVEEDMTYLAASSDSTEEDTPYINKRYRVAVRKVPSNRYQKVSDKFKEEKPSQDTSATIFNDATSGSSEDEFVVSNRKTPVKAPPSNSSSSDSDGGAIEETQISPGAEAESVDYHMGDKGTSGARNNLTVSPKPKMKRKGKPLSTILKSTNSYKKAKIAASQSEFEDSECQDAPETQPDHAVL